MNKINVIAPKKQVYVATLITIMFQKAEVYSGESANDCCLARRTSVNLFDFFNKAWVFH